MELLLNFSSAFSLYKIILWEGKSILHMIADTGHGYGCCFSLSTEGKAWRVSLAFRHSCSLLLVQKPLASLVIHEREAGASFILMLVWIAWRSGEKKKKKEKNDGWSSALRGSDLVDLVEAR